jgi:hypothetical protein
MGKKSRISKDCAKKFKFSPRQKIALIILAILLCAVNFLVFYYIQSTHQFYINGMDMHDGTMIKSGKTYYLYGERESCGFTWLKTNTTWCGFAVSTSLSPKGPWSQPKTLFSPISKDNWGPDVGMTWNWVCGREGSGCFNPRMVQRMDGMWLLWFNAPSDYFAYKTSSYYVMSCSGPLGPCGQKDGTTNFTHKPSLTICADAGDFTIVNEGATAAIICSTEYLSEELLNKAWTDGTGSGSTKLADVDSAEGVGAYKTSNGVWVMTFSSPQCGYCNGTKSAVKGITRVSTGWASSNTILGPWKNRGKWNFGAGQPRTVVTFDGKAWEEIDEWTGSRNEATANLKFILLPSRIN